MSVSVTIRVPDGIILATDSRLTIARNNPGKMPDLIFLDAAQKVIVPGHPNRKLAVSFYGTAAFGIRSCGDLIAEWAREQGVAKPVETVATELHAFLSARGLNHISLCLAGFDDTGYFGRIFELFIPGGVTELLPNSTHGLQIGGQDRAAKELLGGLTVPYDLLSLQGAADLARWLIDITARAQSFSFGPQSVGGAAQVCVLERGKPARMT